MKGLFFSRTDAYIKPVITQIRKLQADESSIFSVWTTRSRFMQQVAEWEAQPDLLFLLNVRLHLAYIPAEQTKHRENIEKAVSASLALLVMDGLQAGAMGLGLWSVLHFNVPELFSSTAACFLLNALSDALAAAIAEHKTLNLQVVGAALGKLTVSPAATQIRNSALRFCSVPLGFFQAWHGESSWGREERQEPRLSRAYVPHAGLLPGFRQG